MHMVEYYDGALVLDECGHDWLNTEPKGVRFVRPGGYGGAPTAELVRTAVGWVGTSFLMQPPRSVLIPPDRALVQAIRVLELAEAEGQSSATWVPLRARDDAAPGYGLHTFHEPGHPQRLAKMHEGQCHTYIETLGPGGLTRWMVAINGVLQTMADGMPVQYDDLNDAVYEQEREDV